MTLEQLKPLFAQLDPFELQRTADRLIPTALELIRDDKRLATLHTNVLTLAQHDSANRIAEEVMKLARK